MISANNRNPREYLDCVIHAMKTDRVVPHPRHRLEWAMLWFWNREIALYFAETAVMR